MIFSLVSIMVTIISMKTTKQILDSQGYAVVKFDVTGSVTNKLDECRNETRRIGSRISDALGLDKDLIEIQRPKKIPNGLQMILEIHLNHIQSRDIDYEETLTDLYQNGTLSEILRASWDLQIKPEITSFEFKVHESKNRQRRLVTIQANSNSVHEFPQNIGTLPPQPIVSDIDADIVTNGFDDDNDDESSSHNVVDTNGMLIDGETPKQNDDSDDNKMKELDDTQRSFVELYKIEGVMNEERPRQKKEDEEKDGDLETMEGGLDLENLSDRQKSTAF